MTFTGTSGNLSVALYLASLAEVGQGRTLTRVEVAAIAWGVNILSGIINTIGTKAIGHMSSFNLWWTLGGTFVLVITLLVKAPVKVSSRLSHEWRRGLTRRGLQNSAAFVFTDYEKYVARAACILRIAYTNPRQLHRLVKSWICRTFRLPPGTSSNIVHLTTISAPGQAVYTLEGCETAAQVAEEAKRAEVLAPLAVVGSIIGSWFIGLAYMLALLFSVQSIASVQGTAFAIPIAQLYYDAVGKRLTLMCLTVVALAQFMAAVTAFTASSRLFYALARDNAFPLKSRYMALNRYQAPYFGVWTSVLIGCIISCAYIGSAVAVSDHDRMETCGDAWGGNADGCFCSVQCDPVLCCHRCHAQLPAADHYPRFLADHVVSVPHRCALYALFQPRHASLPERGPFSLGQWSWSVNFASFLVSRRSCRCMCLTRFH